mmetsp:Transcript_19596/g.50226  ORF Transcript_19596/g.50226 Transcript_19596/m.50226 type:complete len:107 (-) Transcript_19596:22-342(-)
MLKSSSQWRNNVRLLALGRLSHPLLSHPFLSFQCTSPSFLYNLDFSTSSPRLNICLCVRVLQLAPSFTHFPAYSHTHNQQYTVAAVRTWLFVLPFFSLFFSFFSLL